MVKAADNVEANFLAALEKGSLPERANKPVAARRTGEERPSDQTGNHQKKRSSGSAGKAGAGLFLTAGASVDEQSPRNAAVSFKAVQMIQGQRIRGAPGPFRLRG